jgi:hypothetical protein
MKLCDLIKLEIEAMACAAIARVTYPLEMLQWKIAEDDDYIGPDYIIRLLDIKDVVANLCQANQTSLRMDILSNISAIEAS